MSTDFPILPTEKPQNLQMPFLGHTKEGMNYDVVISQTRPERSLIGKLLGPSATLDWGDGAQTNSWFLGKKLASSPPHVRRAIAIDPLVMHGNPVFQGTRIPVYQVVEELADGTRLEELPECFPSLNDEKVQAGLDFAVRLLRIYDD